MFPISKANTRATAKYQAKIGLVAKTYKLKADIVNNFKTACELSGESQAAALTRFMVEYAEKNGNGAAVANLAPLDGQMETSNTVHELKNEQGSGNNSVLEKWAIPLSSATKKEGLPCIYQYSYGKDEPHIFVKGERVFIPKGEAAALISLGAVFENKPNK